jgi:iron complex transport system ATP-binding protein
MRLDARGITWSVGGAPIVQDVDLSCPPGSVTGLLGPNGSGKTTLLHVLAGLRRPDLGSVTVDDVDVLSARPGIRAERMALVEQQAQTGLELTVRQVVELGRIPHRSRWTRTRARDRHLVEQAMRMTQVEHLADRAWSGLSGGERQRTHLARAVAQQPDVLLLDEPTNHLDIGHQLDFLERVRGLGVTTVAALHDLELAATYCDQLLVLDRGRVVASGPVAAVLTPALISEVYGVAATVEPHPRRAGPHVRLDGVLDPLAEVLS